MMRNIRPAVLNMKYFLKYSTDRLLDGFFSEGGGYSWKTRFRLLHKNATTIVRLKNVNISPGGTYLKNACFPKALRILTTNDRTSVLLLLVSIGCLGSKGKHDSYNNLVPVYRAPLRIFFSTEMIDRYVQCIILSTLNIPNLTNSSPTAVAYPRCDVIYISDSNTLHTYKYI